MRARSLLLLALSALGTPAFAKAPASMERTVSESCSAWEGPELAKRLDTRTDSVQRGGNAVTLLVDGDAAFARRRENTAGADLVLVKTFIFTDDETGRGVADLLRERARAGATVIVQYDLKGSLDGAAEALALYGVSKDDTVLRDKPLLADLARDGVLVVPTNVPRTRRGALRLLKAQAEVEGARAQSRSPKLGMLGAALTRFDHEKYWITGHVGADGEVTLRAILGGMNVASEYAYGGTGRVDAGTGRGGWRDTDIEVAGPVTTDIVKRYFDVLGANIEDWPATLDRAKWEAPQADAGTASARFVWNQPSWGTTEHIERLYRLLVQATPAESPLRFESAYFTPGPKLRKPLVRRLRLGGQLEVLTNSATSTDIGLVTTASRGAYASLLDAGPHAGLYEWRPSPGRFTLHSKIASFGSCGPVIVGSANLDGLSSLHNSESVLVVWDPALRAAMDATLDADVANADRVTPDHMTATPTLVRWTQRSVYWLGWRFL